jgi:hypothetical protein
MSATIPPLAPSPAFTPHGLSLPARHFPYWRQQIERIEAQAHALAPHIAAAYPSPAALRSYAAECRAAGHHWLAGTNQELADELDRGPLWTAACTLYKQAGRSTGRTFVADYQDMLDAHLKAQAEQQRRSVGARHQGELVEAAR